MHGVGKSKNLRILLKSKVLKSKNYCTGKERSWARVQFLSLKSTAHKGSFYIQPLDSRNLRIPAGLYLSSIQLILKEDTMMKEEQIFFCFIVYLQSTTQEESVTQWSFHNHFGLMKWNLRRIYTVLTHSLESGINIRMICLSILKNLKKSKIKK